MKTNNLLWSLCCFLLLTSQLAIAQDPDAVCRANQRTVSQMLQAPNLTAQEREIIYNLVKPCADQGDMDAICNMGILYKEGIYVKRDFDIAFDYFKRSADAGHQKGIYAVGYFYMKGLGNVTQDYAKAVDFFDKDYDLMGRHWLSFCQYFGYGLPQDKVKAIEHLDRNFSINSQTLVEHFIAEVEPTTANTLSQFNSAPDYITEFIDYPKLNTALSNRVVIPVPSIGTYNGHIVEYDWSGKNVWRYIPIKVVIEADQSVANSSTVIANVMRADIASEDIIFHGIWKNGVLLFRAFQFELPRLYSDDPNDDTLSYSLNDIVFRPTPSNGKNFITGIFRGGIKEFNEPMNPMVMVIEPESRTNGSEELNKHDVDVKIYPNPVDDLLTVEYELETDSQVGISISNLDYSYFKVLQTTTFREKGVQKFKSRVPWLPSGTYQIWTSLNGKLNYKTIVKN